MTTPSWFGQPESQELEYKQAEALDEARKIAREVVGMLNARGGTVVIGVRDDASIQGVQDAERQRDRLQQVLNDTIEPRPLDVRVDLRALPTGATVLEVRVAGDNGPYALRRRDSLTFVRRTGAINANMSWSEVRRMVRESAPEPLPDWWDGLQEVEETVFVLQAVPEGATRLAYRDIEEAVADREAITFRQHHGWSVLRWSAGPVKKARGVGRTGLDGFVDLAVRRSDGVVTFQGTERYLNYQSQPRVLHAYAIVEAAATFVRFLAKLGERATLSQAVTLRIGLWHAAGWKLPPHVPGSTRHLIEGDRMDPCDDDTIDPAPHRTTWQRLRDTFDTAEEAAPLVRGFYDWFGYDESVIPGWNPRLGRFEFPP